MQITRNIQRLILGIAFVGSTQALAQQPSGIVSGDFTNYRFDFVESSSPWIGSLNPAGLSDFEGRNISFGEASFDFGRGELRNYFQSNNSFEFRAGSRSLYRFSDKVVGRGAVSYTNFTGADMSGSVFLDPYSRPFDILDFDSSNSGSKNLEYYTINGAISVQLFPALELGAEIDFNSANYAKMKDLRYKTSYSLLDGTVALRYSPFSNFHIGLGYTFSQEIEGITFSFYGPENILYRELISFGGFWGVSSTYSELSHNFVKNSRQPFIELSHRLAAQISYTFLDNYTIFVEGYYKTSDGSYGLRTPSSVVHTQNNNVDYGANAALLYATSSIRHKLSFSYSELTMENYRTVYRDQNLGGGSGEVVYFDPLKVGDNSQSNYSIAYQGDLDIMAQTPRWQINAAMALYSRHTFATIYPFYRSQSLTTASFTASLLRNFSLKKSTISVSIASGYKLGDGTPFEDGFYVTPSQDMTKPRYSDEMLQREWDFLTAAQYKINPMIRYSHLLGAKSEIYVQADYSFANAFKLHDRSQHSLRLTIGCNF